MSNDYAISLQFLTEPLFDRHGNDVVFNVFNIAIEDS